MDFTQKRGNSPGYLEGQLLVATPLITESCFSHAVILVCAHNDQGAMGIIVNQVIDNVSYKEIFEQLDIDSAGMKQEIPVHLGGPVETGRGFILHSGEYKRKETVRLQSDIFLTSSVDILRDIAGNKGPKQTILALGYAGWAPGQLESELESNSWLTVPPSEQLIFNTADEEKWQSAAESIGIDIFKLSGDVGHA